MADGSGKVAAHPLKRLLPEPSSLLRGPRGPWPTEQERLLSILLDEPSAFIPRQKLAKAFGSQHRLNRAIKRLNIRLKHTGLQITKHEMYVIEKTKRTNSNQLPLFKS